jgi:hypothetical protein
MNSKAIIPKDSLDNSKHKNLNKNNKRYASRLSC